MSGGTIGGDVNAELYEWLCGHYQRGRVVVCGDATLVGKAVRFGQRGLTADGRDSRWSHTFIMGDVRPDRRALAGQVTRSPYLFESDFAMNPRKKQLKSGAQESWLGKWCHTQVTHVAVLDLEPDDETADAVCATALQLVDEQMRYPLAGILDTWWAIVRGKTWKANPKHSRNAMYCSAFVRFCWQQAGRDFVSPDIALSNTAPEHIAQARPFRAEWHA